jgi:PAS domain S-box-containing protein
MIVGCLQEAYQVHSRRVFEAEAMAQALGQETWDVVLCGYRMAGFGILPALQLLREHHLDLPFIIVSAVIGEESAVQAMRAGAHDYIMKDRLIGLPAAVARELGQAQARRDRRSSLEKTAYLAAIVESLRVAIIGSDLEGRIASWNGGAEQLYGYSALEALGKPLEWIVPPALHHQTEAILAALRRGECFNEVETVGVRKDGLGLSVLLSGSPIRGDGGRIIGSSTLTQEITGSKRREEECRRAIAPLDDALSQIKAFSRLLSICAGCKRVRDEQGSWKELQLYISSHWQTNFSHSICPDCMRNLYPEFCRTEAQSGVNK